MDMSTLTETGSNEPWQQKLAVALRSANPNEAVPLSSSLRVHLEPAADWRCLLNHLDTAVSELNEDERCIVEYYAPAFFFVALEQGHRCVAAELLQVCVNVLKAVDANAKEADRLMKGGKLIADRMAVYFAAKREAESRGRDIDAIIRAFIDAGGSWGEA